MKNPTVSILFCAVAVLGTGVSLYLAQDSEKPGLPSAASNGPVVEIAEKRTETATAHSATTTPAEPVADNEGISQRQPGALTDPISKELAYYPGKPLIVSVEVGVNQTPALVPNQIGEFPRVYVKPNQKVSIRLRFPEALPGAKAAVSVEDGGYVGDKKPASALVLDDNRESSFDFTAGADSGQYRVVVRQGADTRILVLWAESNS